MLGQTPGQLGQVFLPPRGIAKDGQAHQRRQRPAGRGFDPVAILGPPFEMGGARADLPALGIAAGPRLFLHRGPGRFAVLGLPGAPGVGDQFDNVWPHWRLLRRRLPCCPCGISRPRLHFPVTSAAIAAQFEQAPRYEM